MPTHKRPPDNERYPITWTLSIGLKINPVIKPTKIATPPCRGVGAKCVFLELGWSINLMCLANGIRQRAAISVMINEKILVKMRSI